MGNRWDKPYFEIRENEATPIQEIIDTLLFQEKHSKDPVSTQVNQVENQ